MIAEGIKCAIEDELKNATVFVWSPRQDEQHFEAIVISSEFEGLPLIAQHKRIKSVLKEAFSTTVHALALKTFTPENWEKRKHEFDWIHKGA